MKIRKSTEKDIPRMMEIYAYARSFMAEHGNPNPRIAYEKLSQSVLF